MHEHCSFTVPQWRETVLASFCVWHNKHTHISELERFPRMFRGFCLLLSRRFRTCGFFTGGHLGSPTLKRMLWRNDWVTNCGAASGTTYLQYRPSLVPRPRPAFRRFQRGESLGTRLVQTSYTYMTHWHWPKSEGFAAGNWKWVA